MYRSLVVCSTLGFSAAVASLLTACSTNTGPLGSNTPQAETTYTYITSKNIQIAADFAFTGVDLAMGGFVSSAIDIDPNTIATGGVSLLSARSPQVGPSKAARFQQRAFGHVSQVAHARDNGTCPSVSVDNAGDSTYTFSNCTFYNGNDTLMANGAVALQAAANPESYGIIFEGLLLSEEDGTSGYQLGITGGRLMYGNATTLELQDYWDWTLSSHASADSSSDTTISLNDSLGLTFTANSGQSIDFASGALPAGTITTSDGWLWVQEAFGGDSLRGFDFLFSTPTPLQYDPTCTSSTGNIVGGVLLLTTFADSGSAQITYNPCGQAPTVTYVSPDNAGANSQMIGRRSRR